jgi:hypothetical protein
MWHTSGKVIKYRIHVHSKFLIRAALLQLCTVYILKKMLSYRVNVELSRNICAFHDIIILLIFYIYFIGLGLCANREFKIYFVFTFEYVYLIRFSIF